MSAINICVQDYANRLSNLVKIIRLARAEFEPTNNTQTIKIASTSGHRCDLSLLEYAFQQDEFFKTHYINISLNDEYQVVLQLVKKDMFLS